MGVQKQPQGPQPNHQKMSKCYFYEKKTTNFGCPKASKMASFWGPFFTPKLRFWRQRSQKRAGLTHTETRNKIDFGHPPKGRKMPNLAIMEREAREI